MRNESSAGSTSGCGGSSPWMSSAGSGSMRNRHATRFHSFVSREYLRMTSLADGRLVASAIPRVSRRVIVGRVTSPTSSSCVFPSCVFPSCVFPACVFPVCVFPACVFPVCVFPFFSFPRVARDPRVTTSSSSSTSSEPSSDPSASTSTLTPVPSSPTFTSPLALASAARNSCATRTPASCAALASSCVAAIETARRARSALSRSFTPRAG